MKYFACTKCGNERTTRSNKNLCPSCEKQEHEHALSELGEWVRQSISRVYQSVEEPFRKQALGAIQERANEKYEALLKRNK